jgi:DNA-binding NarL/FixJ family response regulator
MIRIFIAEDERLYLHAIVRMIEAEEDMTVVGTAENGHDAVERIGTNPPDVVLLDLAMPVMDGLACLQRLRAVLPDLKIVILSSLYDEDRIVQALAYGANGYLIKDPNPAELIRTIRNVAHGQHILNPDAAAKLSRYLLARRTEPVKRRSLQDVIREAGEFTERECEILELMYERWGNREIAQRLFLSVGTVKNHIMSILGKLGVRNRRDAIRYLNERLNSPIPADPREAE